MRLSSPISVDCLLSRLGALAFDVLVSFSAFPKLLNKSFMFSSDGKSNESDGETSRNNKHAQDIKSFVVFFIFMQSEKQLILLHCDHSSNSNSNCVYCNNKKNR